MNPKNAHSALVDWSYQGCGQRMSDELFEHVSACEECAAYAKSVAMARALGERLPATNLGQVAHDALKLKLVAETRRWANASGSRNPRRIRSVVWAVAATIGITTAAAAAFLVVRRPVVPPGGPKHLGTVASSQSAPKAVPPSAQSQSASPGEQPSATSRVPPTVHQPAVATTDRKVPASSASTQPTTAPAANDSDDEFARAWSKLRANRASEAAKQFDVLLERSNLDKARRVDVLYWSAQAHRRAGNTSMACARSSRLLREYPGSALAPNAALLLGEVAVEQHQPAQAKHYLERARTSSHPLVQARAERALKMLDEHAPPL